jgi:hypothetical protein
MIGSIIGGAMKLGGSIFGGIKASREAKKQQKMLDAQKAENQAWYNRRYNEEGTQRADAQRLLTNTQDLLRRQTKAAQGANAVTGASTEAVAAQKAANNQALAEATSTIAAASDARKDNIEQQYQTNNNALADKQMQISRQKQNAITQAVQGVAGAADSIGGINDRFDKDTEKTK